MEKKVLETIKNYKLLSKKDKVLVAASGGKDSTVILYLLKKFGYTVEALFIDLGIENYSNINKENIRKFCKNENIKLHIISFEKEFGFGLSKIKNKLGKIDKNLKVCTMCGILRRYLLNKIARRLKADKIATGHNLDDEAQAILMNLFKANTNVSARLGPLVGVLKDKKFIPRVKPLYFISEEDIREYSVKKKFPILYERCPYVQEAYRNYVRNLLNKSKEKQKGIKLKIVKKFLELLPELKKRYSGKLSYCELCKEPSSGKVCNRCMLLKRLTLNNSK